jgi:hypothetical protein
MTTPHDNSAPILTPEQWEKLELQLGFGNPAGPLWFLGMEEGVSEAYGSLQSQLRERADQFTGPIRDLPTALRSGHDPSAAPPKLPSTPTWKIMARLARLLVENADDWNDRQKVDGYIRTRLGAADGDTFLIDLLPHPAPNMGVWPTEYATRYADRAAYEHALLSLRQGRLRGLVQKHRPRCLICYGYNYWERYQGIFEAIEWTVPELEQSLDKRRVKLFMGRTAQGTTVLLTPFFRFDLFPERILRQLPSIL